MNMSVADMKAVVLSSGGQDSTTCLAWAIDQFGRENVEALGLFYGQRHRVELEQAQRIAELLRVPYGVIDIPDFGGAVKSALTSPRIDVSADATGTGNDFAEQHGLPSTFVPGRNLVFCSIAAAYGAARGMYHVVTGPSRSGWRSGNPRSI
jgi:7-cyano-7-deazaguanine synthase